MNADVEEIQKFAEAAVRAAGGDWKSATRHLREQLAANESLRSSLLEQAMAEELRRAATRLGDATRKCPYCSEIIAFDATKCRFCGEWVDESASPAVPRPPSGRPTSAPVIRHFTLLTGWVLIVLLIILIISFAR